VIAIIAVLIGLLLPAVQKVREASARTSCASNLHQIATAVLNFNSAWGTLPNSRRDANYTWMVEIMPQMEQDTLQKQWTMTSGSFYTQNATARLTPVKAYFCPSRGREAQDDSGNANGGDQNDANTSQYVPGAVADYAACVGSTGGDYWWDGPTQNQTGNNTPTTGVFRLANNWSTNAPQPPFVPGYRLTDITDGTSTTFLVGEKHVRRGHFGEEAYGDGAVYNGDHGHALRGAGAGMSLAKTVDDSGTHIFGSYHTSVCQFAFCDGSVRPISNSIDTTTLGYLAARNDGQVPTDY